MTAEIELQKAAVELKIDQEELRSDYSDDKSGVGEASPALALKASPDVPHPPRGSPSEILPGMLPIIHVQTVATHKEATVKQEVSLASVPYLSNVSPPEQHVSEQRTPYRSTLSETQVAPQPVHTPLEQALLQTVQQLAH